SPCVVRTRSRSFPATSCLLRKFVSGFVSPLAELSPPWSPAIASDLPPECDDDAASVSLPPLVAAPDSSLFGSSLAVPDTAAFYALLRAAPAVGSIRQSPPLACVRCACDPVPCVSDLRTWT